MLKEALTKLQTEISAVPNDEFVSYIGSLMMDHIRNHPDDARLVLAEGKTIAGSLKQMEDEAKKKQKNGRASFTPNQGFAIVLKYYGVYVPEQEATPEPASAPALFTASLDDLL